MNEVCFCGWSGVIEDRTYLTIDDAQEALACPSCGRIDFLEYLPALSREDTFEIAKARTAERMHSVTHVRPTVKKAAA